MRTLLVTGDHLLTAISTAYASGILKVRCTPHHALPCRALYACRHCRPPCHSAAALVILCDLTHMVFTPDNLLWLSLACLHTVVYCSSFCLSGHCLCCRMSRQFLLIRTLLALLGYCCQQSVCKTLKVGAAYGCGRQRQSWSCWKRILLRQRPSQQPSQTSMGHQKSPPAPKKPPGQTRGPPSG